jgi:hypothetical protein
VAPQEIVELSSTVSVGVHSRAELVFPDRTLARLGGETSLGIKPDSREFRLERGTLLVEVPHFRGGARVRCGHVVATAGSATILIEHLPGKSLKVAVLEGDLRVAVDGFIGDSIVLTPGKLLITTPDARQLPDPVDVDLRTLAATSSLVNPALFLAGAVGGAEALPSTSHIESTITRQSKLVQKKTLIPTNLVILGSGTKIVIPTQVAEAQPGATQTNPRGGTVDNESASRSSTSTAANRTVGDTGLPPEPLPVP